MSEESASERAANITAVISNVAYCLLVAALLLQLHPGLRLQTQLKLRELSHWWQQRDWQGRRLDRYNAMPMWKREAWKTRGMVPPAEDGV